VLFPNRNHRHECSGGCTGRRSSFLKTQPRNTEGATLVSYIQLPFSLPGVECCKKGSQEGERSKYRRITSDQAKTLSPAISYIKKKKYSSTLGRREVPLED